MSEHFQKYHMFISDVSVGTVQCLENSSQKVWEGVSMVYSLHRRCWNLTKFKSSNFIEKYLSTSKMSHAHLQCLHENMRSLKDVSLKIWLYKVSTPYEPALHSILDSRCAIQLIKFDVIQCKLKNFITAGSVALCYMCI
jgi:hypothetical protein